MITNVKRRAVSVGMITIMLLGLVIPAGMKKVHAADNMKKITISDDHKIVYGEGAGGYTLLKKTSFDDGIGGNRPVLCMQPAEVSPPNGTYTISKALDDGESTGKWNAIRNIVYYTPGYPGYSLVKDTWFKGYTRDEAIGIMHLAASYCNAGRPANLNTFGGTTTASLPDRIWNKAKSIGNELWKDGGASDENVPSGFRVLYVKIGSYRDMVCGYMNLGKLKLTKAFEGNQLTDGNRCYSKAGITFTVYDADTNAKVGRFTTDKDGKVTPSEIEVDEGTYKVVESHSKIGYTGNGDSKLVKVEAGKAATVSFSDKPIVNPVSLLLSKVDDGTGKGYPQGAATLEGAEFTVKYYDGFYSSYAEAEKSDAVKKTWIFKTDSKGEIYLDKTGYKVSGDELYLGNDGKVIFPLGTVTLQETKAPTGYLLDSTVHIRNITDSSNGKAETVETYKVPTSREKVKRGDLLFVKSAAGKERLAGIPFKITSKTTGESHIVITDENGYVNTSSSWNLHSKNTNAGKTSDDGIWFGKDKQGNIAPVDDKLGALPYDTYTIEEQKCKGNKGYDLVNVTATIKKDMVTINLGTIDDPKSLEPRIRTTATDEKTKSHNAKVENKVTIIDKVEYKDLEKGKEYILKGKLVLKDDKEKELSKLKVLATSEIKFTAKDKDGEVEVRFTFDGSKLSGRDVVAFEYLYDKDMEIAKHENIEDKGQTVHFTEEEIPPKETPKNPSSTPKTGDTMKLLPWVAALVLAAGGTLIMAIKRKKNGSEDVDTNADGN